MNFSQLINKQSYKRTFNALYSNKLKYEDFKNIREIDVQARSAWDFLLKSQPQRSNFEIYVGFCKDFQNQDFACAELQNIKSKLFHDFDDVSWQEVLGSNIINPSSLSGEEVCSTIFWFLTMNSFDPNKELNHA
jgi:hypothetical protein